MDPSSWPLCDGTLASGDRPFCPAPSVVGGLIELTAVGGEPSYEGEPSYALQSGSLLGSYDTGDGPWYALENSGLFVFKLVDLDPATALSITVYSSHDSVDCGIEITVNASIPAINADWYDSVLGYDSMSVSYDPAVQVWFRVRFTAAAVAVFETSADGTSWTEQLRSPAGMPVDQAAVGWNYGMASDVVGTKYAHLSDVVVSSSGAPLDVVTSGPRMVVDGVWTTVTTSLAVGGSWVSSGAVSVL